MAIQNPASDYTGAGLIEFLDAAVAKGWFNVTSAKALKTASLKVLEIEIGWEDVDLRTVDIDALFQRFRNLRRNDYSDSSLKVYKTRFEQAVKMYVSRLNNDANWLSYGPSPKGTVAPKVNGESAAKPRKRSTKPQVPGPAAAEVPSEAVGRLESPALMRYPFPLRDDVDALLSLPRDLTKAEAARLGAFLSSLAREDGA
jgi:hypothetical protein